MMWHEICKKPILSDDKIDYKNKYEICNKALDKLLDMCTEDDVCCLSHNCPNIEYDFDEGICLGKCPTKEELKEYLLSESEKQ